MTRDSFEKMTQKPYDLGPSGREEIRVALTKYLDMSAADCASLIEDIEKTGEFRVFGYGSLMGSPHASPDEEYAGVLPNWQRGVFCNDRHYRGTPNELGVTMGAEVKEGESIKGLVKVETADVGAEGSFKDRVLRSIHAFALRETSANPIYAYKLVDIETEGHGTVKALLCAVDPDEPSYIGDQPTPVFNDAGLIVGAEGLSVEEKAAIIASSKGEPGASARNTGLDYWQYILHCTYEAGMEPEPHILEMVQLANAYREKLPEDLRLDLEAVEAQNPDRKNYDARAFVASEGIWKIDQDRETYTLRHARNALGNQDPLSSERREIIDRNKHELEEILSPD